MKKKLILSVVSLMSVLGMAACNNTTASSTPAPTTDSATPVSTGTVSSATPSSSSSAVTLTKLSIINKESLTSFFYTTDSNRSLSIDAGDNQNVSQLISNGVIKITSSNKSAVNVLGIYVVPVGVGASTITVSAGNLSDTVDVYVGNPTTIVPEDTEVGVGKNLAVSIDSEKNSKTLTDYNWTSSDTSIATVNESGVITGVANGSVTITCSLKSEPKEGASVTVTVSDKVQDPVAIKTVTKAGTYTVRGKVSAINTNSYILDDGTGSIMIYKTCKFSMGDIVKVSGSVIVYGTQKQPEFSGTFTETKVGGTVNSMTAEKLTAETLTAAKSSTADTYYNYAKLYKWNATAGTSSSGYLVLNLDGCDDDVEPIKLNTTTFKYETGHYYSVEGYWCGWNSSYSYHAFVITKLEEVSPDTTLVFMSNSTMQVDAKNTRKLSATYVLSDTDKNVNTITWSSSNETIATVDQNGVVTAVAAGTCDIIAKVGGGSAACALTVIDEVSLSAINTVTEASKLYRVKGVVTEVSSKGYLISDGTASIFVYMLNSSSLAYAKGDYIEVTSKTALYDGTLMFENVTKNSSNKNQYGVLDAEVYKLDGTAPDTGDTTKAIALTAEVATGMGTNSTADTSVASIKKYSFTAKVDGTNLVVTDDGITATFKFDTYTSSSLIKTLKDTYKFKVEGYYLGTNKSTKNFIVTKAVSVDETRIDPTSKSVLAVKGSTEKVGYTWSLAGNDKGTVAVSSEDSTIATASLDTANKEVTITPVATGTTTITLVIKNGETVLASNEISVTVVGSKTTLKATNLGLNKSTKDSATEATQTYNGVTYAYTAIGTDSSNNMIISSAKKNTTSNTASILRNTTAMSSGIYGISIALKSNSYANNDILKFEFGDDTNCDKGTVSFSTTANVVNYTVLAPATTYKFFKISFSASNYNLYVTSLTFLLA
jgi:trimeric autotransporter adhesin